MDSPQHGHSGHVLTPGVVGLVPGWQGVQVGTLAWLARGAGWDGKGEGWGADFPWHEAPLAPFSRLHFEKWLTCALVGDKS